MLKTLTKHGNSLALVIDKPILDMLDISADTPLEEIVTTVQQSPARAIAVHGASGAVQGFVNWENVTELFMLDRARRSAE